MSEPEPELRREMDKQLIEALKTISSMATTLTNIESDIKEMKPKVEGLRMFKATVLGISTGVSATVSALAAFIAAKLHKGG